MAEPVDFESLSPEEKQQALAIARGPSPISSTTNMGLQNSVMRDPYAPVIHQPGEGLRAGMQAAQQNIANLPMRAAEAMGAQPGSMGHTAGQLGRGALNFLTAPFGTPEGTAVTAALGPARIGGMAMKAAGLPGAGLAELGGLAGVGAGAAGLTGGDPLGGAVEGLTAGAFGKIVDKVMNMRAQSKQDVLDLSRAVIKEVPWLGQVLPRGAGDFTGQGPIEPVLRVLDPKVGWNILNTKFGQVKAQLVKAVGQDTPVTIPSITAESAGDIAKRISGPQGGKMDASTAQFLAGMLEKQGMMQERTIPFSKAFDELAQAKALAAKAPDGATGWAAREKARLLQDELDRVVADKAPALLGTYKDARTQYGKGMAILGAYDNPGILKAAGAFETGRTGGRVNLGNLAKYLAENVDEYGPTRFPDLYAASNRNAALGASDVTRNVRLPFVRGAHGGESLGGMRITQPTGRLGAPDFVSPGTGIIPGMASVIPPEWLLQQPPGGGPK